MVTSLEIGPPRAHCLALMASKRSSLLQREGNDGDFASSVYWSENRVLLLHKSIALHNKYSKDATNGRGVNRHSEWLRVMQRTRDMTDLFEDPASKVDGKHQLLFAWHC